MLLLPTFYNEILVNAAGNVEVLHERWLDHYSTLCTIYTPKLIECSLKDDNIPAPKIKYTQETVGKIFKTRTRRHSALRVTGFFPSQPIRIKAIQNRGTTS